MSLRAPPSDAGYYLTPFFYSTLTEVQTYYELILDQISRFSPNMTLVVHGYDYAIPRANGPLLGIHMQNRGRRALLLRRNCGSAPVATAPGRARPRSPLR